MYVLKTMLMAQDTSKHRHHTYIVLSDLMSSAAAGETVSLLDTGCTVNSQT